MANFRRPISAEEINTVEGEIHQMFSPDGSINTICDHIRVIYKMTEKIMAELKIVMIYAKRMDKKLYEAKDRSHYDF